LNEQLTISDLRSHYNEIDKLHSGELVFDEESDGGSDFQGRLIRTFGEVDYTGIEEVINRICDNLSAVVDKLDDT